MGRHRPGVPALGGENRLPADRCRNAPATHRVVVVAEVVAETRTTTDYYGHNDRVTMRVLAQPRPHVIASNPLAPTLFLAQTCGSSAERSGNLRRRCGDDSTRCTLECGTCRKLTRPRCSQS